MMTPRGYLYLFIILLMLAVYDARVNKSGTPAEPNEVDFKEALYATGKQIKKDAIYVFRLSKAYKESFGPNLHRQGIRKIPISGLYGLDPALQNKIEKQVKDLNAKGYRIIECVYGPLDWTDVNDQTPEGSRYQTHEYWYKKVGLLNRHARSLYKNHPVWMLGDHAIEQCPETLYESQVKKGYKQ